MNAHAFYVACYVSNYMLYYMRNMNVCDAHL